MTAVQSDPENLLHANFPFVVLFGAKLLVYKILPYRNSRLVEQNTQSEEFTAACCFGFQILCK